MELLAIILLCLWLGSPYIVCGLLTVFAGCSIPILLRFRSAPAYTKITLIVGDLIYVVSMILAVMAMIFDLHIYFGIGMTKDLLFFTFLLAGILLISGEGLFLKKTSFFRASTSTRLIVCSCILFTLFSALYPVSYDFASPEYTFYSSVDGEHEVIVRKERAPISFGPFGAVGHTSYYYEKYAPGVYHKIVTSGTDPGDNEYDIRSYNDHEIEIWHDDEYCYTVTKD